MEKITLPEITEEEYELMKTFDSNEELQEEQLGDENAK